MHVNSFCTVFYVASAEATQYSMLPQSSPFVLPKVPITVQAFAGDQSVCVGVVGVGVGVCVVWCVFFLMVWSPAFGSAHYVASSARFVLFFLRSSGAQPLVGDPAHGVA